MLRKNNNKTLFTTPSHDKNLCIMHKFYQWYRNDISEVDAYNPQKELEQSQKRASEIYNTKSTSYLINGSTSGIIASDLTCVKKEEKVLIWKNAHICHHNAIKLAGALPEYYELEKDENWGIYKPLTPEMVEEKLK